MEKHTIFTRPDFFNNSINIARMIMFHKVQVGDIVVDATCGNGNDTLFLSKLVGEKGKVFAFDTEQTAISNTKTLLEKENALKNTVLINKCHSQMINLVNEKPQLVLFNLGYLPKYSKENTTKTDTTIKAVKDSLSMLKQYGLTLIVIYRGHIEGKNEEKAIKEFVKSLSQQEFNTFQIDYPNQQNLPPIIIGIEKRKWKK